MPSKSSQIAALVAGAMALVAPAAAQLEGPQKFTNCGTASDPVKVSNRLCIGSTVFAPIHAAPFALSFVQLVALDLTPNYLPRGGKLTILANMTFGTKIGATMTHGKVEIDALVSPFVPSPIFTQSEDMCLGAIGGNTCNPSFADGAVAFEQAFQIPTSIPSGVSLIGLRAPLPTAEFRGCQSHCSLSLLPFPSLPL